MGYTHYWEFKKNPAEIENGKQKFITAVELIKEGLKQLTDIELADGLSNENSEPVFSETEVWFNGKRPNSCETCCIQYNEPKYLSDFCKTRREPYDVVVCLTLLCFKEAFGEDFSFKSDGNTETEEGWVRAKTIFQSIKDKRLN